MTGEQTQAKGSLGAQDAKRWLDRTTRVDVRWVNPDAAALKKLNFEWPGGGTFSFDLGGIFQGGEIDGEMFLAEVKNYDTYGDLNDHYQKFAAQAYVANADKLADKFLFITWHPFHVTKWLDLRKPEFIRSSVIKNRERVFKKDISVSEAEKLIDDSVCEGVAAKIWILVLSREQIDHLMLSADHYSIITGLIKRGGDR